jgi:sugar phosphate isomerase/epimerase
MSMKIQFAHLLVLACGFCAAGLSASALPIPENCRIGGFAIGCQAWTFKEFTVFDAIDKTAAAGGTVIEFYPGQKFSADKPDLKFDHNATDEMIAAVKARLAQRGVRAVNYGVGPISTNEADARKIFEFARKLELYAVTTESVEALDTIEKLVKEFDIRVGIHNHPRREQDPNYKVWDPNYILSIVKGRDQRIGAAADVGHWVRSGLDPVASLKILKGRVVSVHLKDLNEKSAAAHDVPYGAGISRVGDMLDELKRQHFTGNVSIEYEDNWKDNVADVAQCIGFVRGHAGK